MLRHAIKHVDEHPNRNFVWQREDGTYAVCHCWPVKFNEQWKKSFESSVGINPDKTAFSPRAAAEFRTAMTRVFGPKARRIELVYSRKTQANTLPVLVAEHF